jgi:hypothetical protein
MPALPRVHLKTSNIHNFLTIAPKIMKFALTRSVFQDAFSQKSFKKSKNSVRSYDAAQNWFVPIGTSGPLGVKKRIDCTKNIKNCTCHLLFELNFMKVAKSAYYKIYKFHFVSLLTFGDL